ncbi:MAG TPA: hypothetical protein VN936_05975 [Candidatus Acidoferrum sp.]|nr:hypothetical protein [Candidatus Acidoferrum sp.]
METTTTMTHVYALRPGGLSKLDALPPDACLYLCDRLSQAEARTISGWLQARPGSTLRFDGPAGELIDRFDTLPRNIEIGRDAVPLHARSFDRVERVTFSGSSHPGRWLQHFPNARVVRIALHGGRLDAGDVAVSQLTALSLAEGTVTNLTALHGADELRTLELRDVAVDAFESVGRLGGLRSLRLCAVERLASIQALRDHGRLRSLWLERLPFLRRLSDLQSLPALESLDLSALWQFGMHDAEVLFALPALRRAGIDIGGKRKNIEIIKRLRLPAVPPYSFEGEASANGS